MRPTGSLRGSTHFGKRGCRPQVQMGWWSFPKPQLLMGFVCFLAGAAFMSLTDTFILLPSFQEKQNEKWGADMVGALPVPNTSGAKTTPRPLLVEEDVLEETEPLAIPLEDTKPATLAIIENTKPATLATSEATKPVTLATSEETKPAALPTSESTKPAETTSTEETKPLASSAEESKPEASSMDPQQTRATIISAAALSDETEETKAPAFQLDIETYKGKNPLPKAYFFLLHGELENLEQFRRLWDRVLSPESFFVVHLPTTSGPEVHEALRAMVLPKGEERKNVDILDPRCITWCGPNSITAPLLAIKKLLSMGDWSHYILLSGTHYLVRPLWYIDSLLRANAGLSFLHGTFQNSSTWTSPPEVCEADFTNDFKNRFYCEFTDDCMNGSPRGKGAFAVTPLGVRPNLPELLKKMKLGIFSGTQWHALSREAALYVAEDPFVKELYDSLFHSVGVADETFFQTALYNNPHLLENTAPYGPTLVYWEPDIGPAGEDECKAKPCVLSIKNAFRLKKDLPEPIFRGVVYARKFENDPSIYEWVDRELLSEPPREITTEELRFPGHYKYVAKEVEDPQRDYPLVWTRTAEGT